MAVVETDTEAMMIINCNDEALSYLGWNPGEDTLFYISLDQTDGVFIDKKGHSVTNNGIQYNSNGVIKGCGYNDTDLKRILATFNNGESFPSQFTIMGFIKTTGNSWSNDHPMGIALSDSNNKVVWGIGFNQTNTYVYFNHLRENVAWDTASVSFSSLNSWHHYALTYNGTTMSCYIDGTLKTSSNVSGSGGGSSSPTNGLTLFGRYLTGSESVSNLANCIKGYIDEVIVEKKSWTASEIQDYLQKVGFIS